MFSVNCMDSHFSCTESTFFIFSGNCSLHKSARNDGGKMLIYVYLVPGKVPIMGLFCCTSNSFFISILKYDISKQSFH